MIRERTTTQLFTENELRYIMERRLCRLALLSSDQTPHIIPVSYEFDGEYFYLSGWNVNYGQGFREIQKHGKLTMLIDDLTSHNILVPRGIEVVGTAETMERSDFPYLRITPTGKTSWGL